MDDDSLIPKAYTAFTFTKIDKIAEVVVQKSVDVIGIISKCEEAVSTIVRGEEKLRRVLELVDDSGVRIFVTVWGAILVQRLKLVKIGDIVAFRQVRVGDFNGRSLTASDMVEDVFLDVKHSFKMQLEDFKAKWQDFEALLKETRSISMIMRIDHFCTIAEMLSLVDE